MEPLADILSTGPELKWKQSTPFSKKFDDPYYSLGCGLAESQHVFLNGNKLSQKFIKLTTNSSFSLAELGFGSGLNFYLSAAEFIKRAPSRSCLNYIACEKYPLSPSQIEKAIKEIITAKSSPISESKSEPKPEQELTNVFIEFLSSYNKIIQSSREERKSPQFYSIQIMKKRINLQLYIGELRGDVKNMLEDLEQRKQKVDAWFLDGFAPPKNPEMWSKAVFHSMANLSKKGTSLTSYSVAASVRSGLAEVGFSLERKTGFGKKRHMLYGLKPLL